MGYSCRMWTPGLTATENVVEALLPVIDVGEAIAAAPVERYAQFSS
jgi:hypothetical protein